MTTNSYDSKCRCSEASYAHFWPTFYILSWDELKVKNKNKKSSPLKPSYWAYLS